MLIAKFDPLEGMPKATWIGKRMDVNCTGLGKALIAYLPEAELDRIVRAHGLPRHNENTIHSPKKLKEDLARVVRLGYALDDEEDELGLRCIGAPVLDAGGRAIAAISIAGTSSEINESNFDFLVRETKITASGIAEALVEADATSNRSIQPAWSKAAVLHAS